MTTHSKTVIGSASTAASRATAGTISIPSGKGGILVAVLAQVYGTLETVVNTGGLVELENDAVDWKPFEFYTACQTCVTSGAAKVKGTLVKCRKNLPPNSTVTVYYTPQDDQSQKLSVTIFWIEGSFSARDRQTYMKSGITAALTQTTTSKDAISISIPAEKGGRVVAIQAQVWGTLETVVNSGGLVALRNESAAVSWEPTEFYTEGLTCVTSGGVELEAEVVPVDLDLPGNSTCKVDYTPQDNQSQKLSISVIWER